MTVRSVHAVALAGCLVAAPLGAQGVVVDQGRFEITIAGRRAGSEEFVIRRAGIGREDAIFANGVVTVDAGAGRHEIRPLLQALPPEGTAAAYQVSVAGAGAMDVRINRSGGRYVAKISSQVGEEDREFQARPDTRVLEQGVAHHYYFVRDLREGRSAHVLEPRTRRQFDLIAGARVEQELRLGRNLVEARRVEFAAGADVRIVWYDRQGRVLRLEIPAGRYVAERTDLVG